MGLAVVCGIDHGGISKGDVHPRLPIGFECHNHRAFLTHYSTTSYSAFSPLAVWFTTRLDVKRRMYW
ncbi:hypothetical protein CA13_58880 [Planctomycetes bacterium CA13]|uniref:Uncharacterized protein n=1 Tax=Novipirellula herctigrandis TaxID=2527986 RepID=A0A5C5ZB34_9BACT|nr:hypothetical protein CA13_58880 [Planctomycetes bacterium CA13]